MIRIAQFSNLKNGCLMVAAIPSYKKKVSIGKECEKIIVSMSKTRSRTNDQTFCFIL